MIPELAKSKPNRECRHDEPFRLTLGGVVWRSALLNAAIVVTSFPVVAWAGGRDILGPLLVVLGGLSLLIWVATFAVYGSVALVSVFRGPASTRKPTASQPAASPGLEDRWLDEPGT
ncbi:hypothetical protein [Aquisphaera insulae]|uniref:hypothetical protein n=1 Tax=Aquisphaera insulae TaxID=2712864 RepID=UPI0013ECFE53|nr:hypothetical protein [Aquisphaera insulae]